MKRLWVFFICMSLLLSLSGCSQQQEIEMPEIVFEYLYYMDYFGTRDIPPYDTWWIEQDGTICHSRDEAYQQYTAKDLMEQYESIKAELDYEVVGTVDVDVLQEKWQILQEIVNGENNEVLIEEDMLTVVKPEEMWYGYYYNSDGELKVVTLRGEGNTMYINQDPRARELADWLDEVFQAEERRISMEGEGK
ncbi:MAG: hypothetical protein K2N24_04585 [Lachnospiraceae bacterium]|nr:hypothetical protein [Lachnospiraceae bacterium]